MSVGLISTGVQFPDATIQTTAAGTVLPGVLGQVFTASGTFTIPTGVTALKVTVVGGGSSGTGAAACCGANNGNAGGTSSVSSGTQTISTISATGGAAAIVNQTTAIAGGAGSGGDLNMNGAPGMNGNISTMLGMVSGGSLYGPGTNPSTAGKLYGGGSATYAGNSCGAGGGSAIKYLTGLTPGGTLTVTRGAGGTAPGGGAAGAIGVIIFEW